MNIQVPQDEIAQEPICFAVGDGRVCATLFHGSANPQRVIIMNSATGVPHGYYKHFANWAAQQFDAVCLTYDYRDFGSSAHAPLRLSDMTMKDWALVDQPAARAEIRKRYPGVPIWIVGHSLGTMLTPVQLEMQDVERVIGVCSGMVRLSDHPWPYRALAAAFWHGHVPATVAMMGYLSGKVSGLGADLPAGAYWQWRRWCTVSGSYLVDIEKALPEHTWGADGIAVDLFACTDDEMTPPASVARLAEAFGPGRARSHLISPADHGLNKVGHLGVFRRANAALWPLLFNT
jgi:predicted alpha/beta hydrolase